MKADPAIKALAMLDAAVVTVLPTRLKHLHDVLLSTLRAGGSPDWEAHPAGRDWFLQNYP